MNLEQINKVYLLGIGGIGMSALARYFLGIGRTVAGYDRTPSPLTNELEKEGASISYQDATDKIPADFKDQRHTLYIYTPAIPSDNQIFRFFQSHKIKLHKRSEVLGLLSQSYQTIGIAGTHGKTTISSITAHILNQSPIGCLAFLGGITKNYKSNLITHASSEWMVVEADEFDRSFLQLHPQIALISAMDADHLDIYGSPEDLIEAFRQYASQRTPNGSLTYKWNLKKYFTTFESSYSYHLSDEKADFYATDMQLRKHQFHFSLQHPNGIIRDLSIPMPGRINLENAVAASAAAILAGVQEKYIREGLQSFAGIKRRMELILQNNKISYYDDYAHHPEEIKASILSIKELYPFEELTVVFQPHLFSRTQDFAPAFAQSLQLADKIILMEIYLAREKPIPGVSSQMIIDLMERNEGQIVQKDQLINHLQNNKPKLLLSLGAGDIDRFVEPIKKAFL